MFKYRISENSKKSNFKALVHRLPFLLLCIFIFFFVSKAAFNAYIEKKRSAVSVENAEAELARLTERKEFISVELKRLSTEEGREGKLREKFGVGSPGEQVAIIIESDEDGTLLPEENIFDKIKTFFESLFEK